MVTKLGILEVSSPEMEIPIFGGQVTIVGYGKRHHEPEFHWSLRTLNLLRDVLDRKNEKILTYVAKIAERYNLERMYAPNTREFNGKIISDFTENKFPFESTFPIYGKLPYGTYLKRGPLADGVVIPKMMNYPPLIGKTAFVMSSADCALIVVKNNETVIAAHAGRNSLVQRIKNNDATDVVQQIMKAIDDKPVGNTQVWIGCSIRPGPHFAHFRYDTRYPSNGDMIDRILKGYGPSCFTDTGKTKDLGWLDIKELARRQFMTCGVPEDNITKDFMCTHSDVDEDGNHIWHSQAREPEKKMRNLMLAIRNF